MKCMCTVFAMLLIFISVTAPVAANEAEWMPDANLRSAVRSALSIADDDALTQQAMQDLTSLTATNSEISNITGLEHATNLTHLDIRDNAITDATPLSALTNLDLLRLKGNTVSDMSALSGLTNLTVLNLRLTGISSVSSLSGLTNLEHLRVDDNNITDVEPLTSLTNLQRLWVAGNELTNAHLLSSLTNLTRLDISIPDPPDTTAPDVSISVPSEVQNGAFDVVITFTEVVSDFLQSDVSLGGTATASITDWDTTDNTVFTAEITPTTSGTVTLDIAADVVTDAANNPNTAATPKTVTVTIADPQEPIFVQRQITDTVAPDVNISVPVVPQNSAFDVVITFTEAVSDFEEADVSLAGTATASITAWDTTDNTVFTATITPTTSGTVILDIAADVATDAASNGNTAATQQTVTVDIDAPSVILTLLPEVESNRIDVQITFSEPVVDFESSDVLVTTNGLTQIDPHDTPGSTPPPIASITGWTPGSAGSTYTVYITTYTQTEGQVIINVPADVAMDSVGNSNTASIELSVDETPEFHRSVFSAIPIGPNWGDSDSDSDEDSDSGTCHIDFDFDRVREKLDINEDGSINAADVALVETALGQSGDGIINARTDINCDDIVDDIDLGLVDDTTPPTVSVTVPTTPQSTSPFQITIRFSEMVTDFDVSDISLEGSTATATITRSGRSYSVYYFTVTPTTGGDLVISVPADVVEDALGNLNTASTGQTVSIDLGIPSVSSLTSTTPTVGSGVFTITITFSEEVSGFVQEDLKLSGTANASITAWESTDNTVFTATVTPASSGSVHYSVPAGVATDTDDNPNTVSKKYSRDIDLDAPTVTVSVPTETQTGAFNVTITFNESVYDFEQTDVSLADSTADATITDFRLVSGKGDIETRSVYEATITPTTSGTVVVSIPADVCTDTAGNNNIASETHTVTINLVGVGNAPSAVLSRITDLLDTTPLASLDLEELEEQLQTLRVQSDGSAEYLQAIAVLESTLAALRPEKTVLLANYPNPFNPETWIPYHLANASAVRITIYDIQGTVVRQLDLGHQREGYYTSRSRAAYWDGRNEFGERVASGLYFYQLEADNMSLLRKMLILK